MRHSKKQGKSPPARGKAINRARLKSLVSEPPDKFPEIAIIQMVKHLAEKGDGPFQKMEIFSREMDTVKWNR